MPIPSLIALSGSARRASLNQKLAIATAAAAEKHGASVTIVDMATFPMPIYNGDLEAAQGFPEHAQRLYSLFKEHDGMIFACPEYNGSITPLLKNTIDWLSRPREGDAGLAAFAGKTAALVSASPGGLGGMRGLVHVRAILSGIGVLVLPDQLAVGSAHSAFADDGSLADEGQAKRLDKLAANLVQTTGKLFP